MPSTEELLTDSDTLKKFINYGMQNFPAEKYDLILWDHGGGPTGGYGSDNHADFWDSDSMHFSDIIDALSDN